MQKGKRKRLAIAVAFALSLSSAVLPGASALAQQGPMNDELTTPFGLVAEYDAEKGIGFVWGEAGYEKYTVTISNSATGYEKVYTDQTLGYKYYPDDYEPGDYLVEIQGFSDGEYSKAASVTVTVPSQDEGSDDKDKGDGDQDTEHGPGSEEDNEEGNSDGSLPTDPDTDTTEGDGQGDKDTDNETDEDDTEESLEDAINFESLDHSADYIDAGTDVTVTYKGKKVVIEGSDWGNDWGNDSHWQIQLKQVIETPENARYDVSFTVSSKESRDIFVKLGDINNDATVYAQQTIALSDGDTKVNITTDKDVDIDNMLIDFALGSKWGSDDNTITISNLKVTPHVEADVKEGAISLADAKTELYVGSDWAGCSAEVKENGTVAQFKVSSYGWNGEWGLQYIIKDLGLVEGGTYTVYADITSSIDKKVLVKLDDSGQIVETITLSSGKTYEYEKEVTIDQLSNDYLYFALGQISGEAANLSGTLTVENLRIKDQDGNYLTLSGGSASGSKGLEYDFDAEDNYLYDYADPGTSKDGYQLIWTDEFDGDYTGSVDPATGLDLDNWAYQYGDGTTDCGNYGWGNNELECYTDSSKNISVNEDLNGDGQGEGLLRITASYEENGYTYKGESQKSYTSARIRSTTATDALFNTTYGYIESRISLPQTPGAWPAFWMLPQSTDIYGGWPVSGEIDILETTGTQADKACSTLHWGVPGHVYKGSGYVPLSSDIRYFHTYAVDWEPGRISFYYDGVEIYTSSDWSSTIPGASDSLSFDAPFDMPFYMILNLAVDSGQFGGSDNKASFHDDINMYVDYVRVYQKNEGYPDTIAKTADENSRDDWEQYDGVNQIADLNGETLDAAGGGHDDNKAKDSGKWYLSNQSDATASASIVTDDEGTQWAKVDVKSQGSQDYGVQLIGHYNARKGYVYRVSFDSYAEGSLVGKQVNCDSKEYAGWSTYGIQTFTLSSEPKTTSFIFEQKENFDNCRIEFNIGGQATGTVYISNVKVEIVDPALIGKTDSNGTHGVMADGNYIYNGTFDQGTDHTGYWSVTSGTTLIVPRYTKEALASNDVKVKDVASMSNYENIEGGMKYYERRAQISADGHSPSIYQPGLKMGADTYTVGLDLYSETDTAVKVSAYTVAVLDDGRVVLDKEIASAKASYKKGDGVRRLSLSFVTKEDIENGALVITFANGTSVQIDNVSMKGQNTDLGYDENPVNDKITWTGDSGAGVAIPVERDADGVYSMSGIKSGATWYSPQIGSSNFSVVSGLKYKFSMKFKMEGTSNNTFEYIVQENGGSWTVVQDIVKVDSKDLTKDADGFYIYETVFTSGASLDDCHLNFGFGHSAATGDLTFYFKDVSLDLVKETSDPSESDNDADVDDGIFVPAPGQGDTSDPGDPQPQEPGDPSAPEDPDPSETGDPSDTEDPNHPDTPETDGPGSQEPDKPQTPGDDHNSHKGGIIKTIVKTVTKVVVSIATAISKLLKGLFGFR